MLAEYRHSCVHYRSWHSLCGNPNSMYRPYASLYPSDVCFAAGFRLYVADDIDDSPFVEVQWLDVNRLDCMEVHCQNLVANRVMYLQRSPSQTEFITFHSYSKCKICIYFQSNNMETKTLTMTGLCSGRGCALWCSRRYKCRCCCYGGDRRYGQCQRWCGPIVVHIFQLSEVNCIIFQPIPIIIATWMCVKKCWEIYNKRHFLAWDDTSRQLDSDGMKKCALFNIEFRVIISVSHLLLFRRSACVYIGYEVRIQKEKCSPQ